MQYELKSRQVCLFIIAFLPISKLFIMPSILAGKANEDLWISALVNLTLDFLTILALKVQDSRVSFSGALMKALGYSYGA